MSLMKQPPKIGHENSRLRYLEERLNDGYELIEKRRDAGLDVSKLEAFWMQLLHEYEGMCEEAGDEYP